MKINYSVTNRKTGIRTSGNAFVSRKVLRSLYPADRFILLTY